MRPILMALIAAALLITGVPGAIAQSGDDEQVWDGVVADADALLAAAPATPTAPGAPAAPGDRLRRALNLTDEQARRVEQILAAHRTRTERLRIDLGRARLDAREVMLQATPDRGRLDAIARRMGEVQGQLIKARFDVSLELKGVLTPEQWSRLQGLWGRRGAMMRGRFR